MKLHEKIKKIRTERDLTLKELQEMIISEFKEKAVSYKTLLRVEAGDTDGRATTLHQISTALGMSLGELKRDTEEENKPVDFIKKYSRLGKYVFNEKAYTELLMRQNRNFMATELILAPGGKTKFERDPELLLDDQTSEKLREILQNLSGQAPALEEYNILKFEKYVYCLRGNITCYIGEEKYVLRYGDGLSFNSSIPHWFENNSKTEARCLIIQNPRHL